MNLYNYPCQLGTALIYFFTHAKMNLHQGNITFNLMDYFPILKTGYVNYDTLITMFNNYCIINNLFDPSNNQFIIPDDLFMTVFNSEMSSLYSYHGVRYILTHEGFEAGLISKELNTFEQLGIDSLRYHRDYNGDIIDINISPQSREYMEIVGINNELLDYETRLSTDISTILSELISEARIPNDTNYIPLYHFLLHDHQKLTITQDFIKNDWIHLIYAIVNQLPELVNKIIIDADPRINNNEAYRLALKVGNLKIINIIGNNVIYRTWLERQVISNQMLPLQGLSNIPETLFTFNK